MILLRATALRLVREKPHEAEVVDQLRDLPGGKQSDLVGRAAAFLLGSYLTSPGTSDPLMIDAAAALLSVGATPDAVQGPAEDVRTRLISGHTNPY